jgi:FkbM family methyltransferase
VLVDLGANVGRFAAEFLALYPAARAVLVEGDPYLNEELKRRFSGARSVQLFQGLIGPESKQREQFFLCQIPEGNSIFHQFSDQWAPGAARQIEVEVISLQELLRLAGIQRVDLLKVDIEGAEWDLLERFEQQLAERVAQLTVEFHDFLDPSLRHRTERCIARLSELGYAGVFREGNHAHGSPYFDCLFYRA